MQTTNFSEGQVIYNAGDPLRHISLITGGDVEASSGWHTHLLSKTDVLGLGGIKHGSYMYSYTAISDVTLYQYPYAGIDSLDALAGKYPDAFYLMAAFMCRHIAGLSSYITRLRSEVEALPPLIKMFNSDYLRMCKLYRAPRSILPELPPETSLPVDDKIPDWLRNYYKEINELSSDIRKAFFRGNTGIVTGFLRIGSQDVHTLYNVCAKLHERLRILSKQLLSSDDSDLFSIISQLHISLTDNDGADFAIDALMASLNEKISVLADLHAVSPGYYQKCSEAYWDSLEKSRREAEEMWGTIRKDGDAADDIDVIAGPGASIAIKGPSADQDSSVVVLGGKPKAENVPEAVSEPSPAESLSIPAGLNSKLTDSLIEILEYSGADGELALSFERSIRMYKNLSDGKASDDTDELRKELNKAFFAVYKLALLKSMNDSSPPSVIKMFLNFGYVDAALAGIDNANYLYGIADSYKGDPERGIYTAREWLISVYQGKNEPSLSEFNMEYKDYVRDLKTAGKIDAAGEKRMMADGAAKVDFEMKNAFPVVNRVTFGNPSKYCPVFDGQHIVRNLKDTLVTPSAISEAVNEVRSVDFSVFYRQTAYINQKLGVSSEHIHVEVLPNIIIMPVTGVRGSMWQDVESRVRTTPARMFVPAFLENDLKTLMTRLAGEFRWEICRRIQGVRWNDITDPSLTSYFCDYLQFFMNNRNIPMQVMNEIRAELSVARNNYKSVFLANYVKWIQNESKGMARLNNIVLGIMMTFCPFVTGIRENLKMSVRYKEALNKYEVRRKKRHTHLTNLIKKITQSGKPVPPELTRELEFWEK